MTIELKVERFENDKVILLTEDSDTIVWPRQKLPTNIKEGALVIFSINDVASKQREDKESAKNILNELLNVDAKE